MRGVAALVLSLLGLCGVCFGAGYNVGDASGWSLGYDYKQWASSKSFQVGDAIDFRYNTGVHNVKLVTNESCNANNALATFSTGLDTLTIQTPGHFYFICGIPAHCQAGMKLHINVSHGSSSPTQNPSSPNTDGPPTVVDTPPAQPASSGTTLYEIGRRARSMKTTPTTPKPPKTPTPTPTTPKTTQNNTHHTRNTQNTNTHHTRNTQNTHHTKTTQNTNTHHTKTTRNTSVPTMLSLWALPTMLLLWALPTMLSLWALLSFPTRRSVPARPTAQECCGTS